MRFYFLSRLPCALKLGGLFVGMIGGAEKFMEIDPSDDILCEFIPTDGNFLPVAFVINEDFSPPNNVKEYLFPSAIALYLISFPRAESAMRLITQRRYADGTATVFLQGRVQFSVETAQGIATHFLSDDFLSSSIERVEDCILLTGEKAFALFRADGEKLLEKECTSLSLDGNELTATLPYDDSLGHYAKCTWVLTDRAEIKDFSLNSRFPLKEELLIYALTESLKIDADVKGFVTPQLYQRIASLKKFLGNYEEVVFVSEAVAGLTYPIKENVFRVVYYTAELVDGKIDNVKEKEMDGNAN